MTDGSRLKLAYITLYDPNDPKQWSGIGHAIMEALRDQGADVVPLGPLHSRLGPVKAVAERLYGLCSDKYYEFQRERIVGWDFAQQISRKLDGQMFDAVICPGAPIAVSELRCRQPIVLWSGATFRCLVHDYGFIDGNCKSSIRAGDRMELSAQKRASLLMFASQWAATSALQDYGADAAKVHLVPFGANLRLPPTRQQSLAAAEARDLQRCRLTSIAVEWERKGIPRVIDLAEALNERGLPTELTVVGVRPPSGVVLPRWVNTVGIIDKSTSVGEQHLGEILSRSHFHVLFSSAECFGLAFCEANAWAVPNIAADVGGIPTAVMNERGGWRFDNRQSIAEIADFVAAKFNDRVAYLHAAERARDEYEQRLNWNVAGSTALRLIADAVAKSRFQYKGMG